MTHLISLLKIATNRISEAVVNILDDLKTESLTQTPPKRPSGNPPPPPNQPLAPCDSATSASTIADALDSLKDALTKRRPKSGAGFTTPPRAITATRGPETSWLATRGTQEFYAPSPSVDAVGIQWLLQSATGGATDSVYEALFAKSSPETKDFATLADTIENKDSKTLRIRNADTLSGPSVSTLGRQLELLLKVHPAPPNLRDQIVDAIVNALDRRT